VFGDILCRYPGARNSLLGLGLEVVNISLTAGIL
jgi:hypothetical protein